MRPTLCSALCAGQFFLASIHFNNLSKDSGNNLDKFYTVRRFCRDEVCSSAYTVEQIDVPYNFLHSIQISLWLSSPVSIQCRTNGCNIQFFSLQCTFSLAGIFFQYIVEKNGCNIHFSPLYAGFLQVYNGRSSLGAEKMNEAFIYLHTIQLLLLLIFMFCIHHRMNQMPKFIFNRIFVDIHIIFTVCRLKRRCFLCCIHFSYLEHHVVLVLSWVP